MKRIGTRLQVMNGLAKQTGGGLKKKDLTYNKRGKIVSKKLSAMAIQRGGVGVVINQNKRRNMLHHFTFPTNNTNNRISMTNSINTHEYIFNYDDVFYFFTNKEINKPAFISKLSKENPIGEEMYFKDRQYKYLYAYYIKDEEINITFHDKSYNLIGYLHIYEDIYDAKNLIVLPIYKKKD